MHTLSSHYEAPFPPAKCKRYSKQRGKQLNSEISCWQCDCSSFGLHLRLILAPTKSISILSIHIHLPWNSSTKIKLNLPHSNLPACQSLGPVRLYSWWWRLQCHIRCNLGRGHQPWKIRATVTTVTGAAEMLMTATEAFCPAPKWWKFTRFLSRTDMNWSWTI